MVKQFALTTVDNPHDPFEDYSSWMSFDKSHGYNSSETLMRIANLTDDMTMFEEIRETERAIDEIIKHDFLNIYKKFSKELTIPEE